MNELETIDMVLAGFMSACIIVAYMVVKWASRRLEEEINKPNKS